MKKMTSARWKKQECFYQTRLVDGVYVHERVDLETGEITKKRMKAEQRKLTGTIGTGKPYWEDDIPNVQHRQRKGSIDSLKSVENPFFGMLDNFAVYDVRGDDEFVGTIVSSTTKELDEDELDNAIASLKAYMPHMDDYFTGVSQLGNNNPLSKNVMFHLLRTLPEISSNTIYQATNYSVSYCQRLATALRVFIKLTT